MRSIDLHTHSYYSDGTLRPSEVARRAAAQGVELYALTDHDTLAGFEEARAEAEKHKMPILAGLEINTSESDLVHILGYGVDPSSRELLKTLEDFRSRRAKRLEMILERLRKSGVPIEKEDVDGVSRHSLGRPHVADALVKRGVVQNRQEAFQRYLVRGKPGYVEPMGPGPEEAIRVIAEAGGLPSLAHPGIIGNGLDVGRYAGLGLRGLEVYYPSHSGPTTQRLLGSAKKFSLLATGGSDHHGPASGREDIGGIQVPDEVFDRIREAL